MGNAGMSEADRPARPTALRKPDELIDACLKRVYHQTLQDEIPDRFTALLDQLRTAESEEDAPTPAKD